MPYTFSMCGHPLLREYFTPAEEGRGLWPWMNAPAFGRNVAPPGLKVDATGFARGAPLVNDSSYAS